MPYIVTVANGLVDLVLPNGMRAQGGQTAFLSDWDYSRLSPTGTANFSAVTVSTGVPSTTLGPQTPVLGNNPYAESDNEPSATLTPLNSPSSG